MRVLSIDTSSEAGGITLIESDKDIYRLNIESTQRVAENIYRYIDEIMKRCRLTIDDIDLFTTLLGPGSFTGLRVSLSVLKSFAIALKKPLLGIETYRVMAYAAQKVRDSDRILVVGNARRNELFVALYDKGLNEKMPIRIIPTVELEGYLEEGDILTVYRDIEVEEFLPEEADYMRIDKDLSYSCAELAIRLYNSGNGLSSVSDIEPVYVRNDVVRIKV